MNDYFIKNDLRELALKFLVDFTDETEGYKKTVLAIKGEIDYAGKRQNESTGKI